MIATFKKIIVLELENLKKNLEGIVLRDSHITCPIIEQVCVCLSGHLYKCCRNFFGLTFFLSFFTLFFYVKTLIGKASFGVDWLCPWQRLVLLSQRQWH